MLKMIGMSVAYKILSGKEEGENRPEILLPKLWNHGVRSIEIRNVQANADPSEVLRIANLLWDYGFNITVHGKTKTVEGAVSAVFEPLKLVLANMRQNELIVTIHPVQGDNAVMLTQLSEHISSNHYPVKIALENNRQLPGGADGDSLSLVLDAVTRADRPNVGTCFDMGHYVWYASKFTDSPNTLPPAEFLKRAIHTHIHSYSEGTTHFPLVELGEPQKLYFEALGYTYTGIYNIELDPKRFAHRWTATEGYLLSADTLKANYPIRALRHDEERLLFDGCFRRSLDVLRKKRGCYGTLLAPSSYLFSTHGYQWAMDVSFHRLRYFAETPSMVREYLGDIDCMLLTHAHGDHLEKRTVRALANTELKWVVPDFLTEKVLELGVRSQYITEVRAGDEIKMGPLNIRVLKGAHKRPTEKVGTPCVGYLVTAENAPSLIFPCDVRDYSLTDGEHNADYAFGHVWLTDHALEPEIYMPVADEFADYMLTKSKKSIFLTHLYVDRTDDKRWTMEHARVIEEAIRKKSPETVVRVPRFGEIFDLSIKENWGE
ncbi:MAG: MBL fold metallo-hydrolase [Clostridia bacterium]|nr:MBL fold metallo-hydrolase [Clostridia bacterium]